MSETQVDAPVQIGPAVANLARSIWRQRTLIVAGLALGLVLGLVLLPKIFTGQSTYEATIRMEVRQLPADDSQSPPAFGGGGGEDTQGGASTDVLKDIEIADAVIEKLKPADEQLTGIVLLSKLNFAPLLGSALVDVSYSDNDPRRAASIVEEYAAKLAAKRTQADKAELNRTIGFLTELAATQRDAAGKADIDRRLRTAQFTQRSLPLTSVVGENPVIVASGPPLSKKVTLAIGLLLGLAIGTGAALLVETAFPKVVTPTDAEEASGLPLIATVRRNGVRRTPLPVLDRPFSPAAEDYRRVASALERQGLGSDIQVLAVASADPGDGRTMLAANLAHSLARQGRAVVLVSSDLRRPQVEKLLGLGQLPGLAEALQDDPLPAIALLVSINDHLLVLPAGSPSKHPGELLGSKRLNETLQTLRQMGLVILDTPPARLSADGIALSGVADATLLVARSGVTRRRSLREATTGLRRDRIRQLGVVLVGTSSPLLRSMSPRAGGYRDITVEAELEELEPPPQPRPLPRGPQSLPSSPRPGWSDRRSENGDAGDVDATRNQRAVE